MKQGRPAIFPRLSRRPYSAALASLLPRLVADFYSKAVRKKPFRNYTYYAPSVIHASYRKPGFGKAKFYGILPNYREIERIVIFQRLACVAASLEGRTPIRRYAQLCSAPAAAVSHPLLWHRRKLWETRSPFVSRRASGHI